MVDGLLPEVSLPQLNKLGDDRVYGVLTPPKLLHPVACAPTPFCPAHRAETPVDIGGFVFHALVVTHRLRCSSSRFLASSSTWCSASLTRLTTAGLASSSATRGVAKGRL